MSAEIVFRSNRLSGRAPSKGARQLYDVLYGSEGERLLQRDLQDWSRNNVAPWTLYHADQAVGIGGFRIGFGDDGLELSFHFLPEVWGQGLASEFVVAAMEWAEGKWRADRIFAWVDANDTAAFRVLDKAGFRQYDRKDDTGARLMRRGLPPGR